MTEQKNYEEIIDDIESFLIEQEQKELVKLPGLRKSLTELRRHATNILKVENSISAIQEEILDPVKIELEENKKVGKFSTFGFYVGALGLAASIISFIYTSFYQSDTFAKHINNGVQLLKDKGVIIVQNGLRQKLLSDQAYETYSQAGYRGAESYEGSWCSHWWIEEENQLTHGISDHLEIKVAGRQISATAHDQETKETYWLDGRISASNRLTLTYWSAIQKEEAAGSVYLEERQSPMSREKTFFIGPWVGYSTLNSADGKYGDVGGITVWHKSGDLEKIPKSLSFGPDDSKEQHTLDLSSLTECYVETDQSKKQPIE